LSYNGSGTFQINTAGQPVVAGTVISSTAFNSLTADLANGLSTAITKDGQTTVTNNIPMAGFKITGLGAATVGTDAARYSQIQGGTDKLITVTGTDTLTGSLTPVLTAYAAGNLFSFVVVNTNTGAVTINIDGVGVKSITKSGSTALAAGDMVATQVALIEYDGTRFQLLNVAAAASGDVVGPASSTANAIPTFSGTTGKLLQDYTKVKIVSNNITMDGSTSGTLTVAAPAAAGTNTVTFPAATDTLVGKATTDTLTNKTLTSPAISSPTISGTPVMSASIITLGTVVASTSGTSIDFTSIPSWVKRIIVMFDQVSTNGTSQYQLQIGTSGGIQITGYVGCSAFLVAGPTASNFTTGWGIAPAVSAADTYSGQITLALLNSSTGVWTCNSVLYRTTQIVMGGGSKTLSGTLDRVKITTVNGTDAFDAGAINIQYE
jgi:hypothetical protein